MTSFFIPRGLRVREADSNPSVIASELVFPNATLSASGSVVTVHGLVVDGDKGDITVSASGATWTIDNSAVTTAKLGGDITTAGKALLDDVDAAAQRTTLGLGTLATQSGTFSGTSSGTNTGDQTNITGNAATVTTNANLTGHVTSVGNAAVLGSFTKAQLDAAVSDGNVLYVGDVTSNVTHTGDVTGDTALTIANSAVTLAKMANLAQDQFIGRTTASTGVPETATITAAARTVLDDTTVGAMVDTLGGASSTGTGGLVRATSPTLVTPNIGAATGTSLVLSGSLTLSTSAGRIENQAFNVNNSQLRMGSIETQSFSLNNSWIGENIFFDGGAFRLRQAGEGGLFYFYGNEGQFRLANSGSALSVASGIITNCQLKITSTGAFAVGPSLSQTKGSTVGATFSVDPSGSASVTGNLTASGTISSTANGAASTPASTLVGTWFTGGSATTTKPQLLVEPTGTTSTGWSTSGTGIGVNAASGFTGNLMDLQLNGASRVSVSSAGNLTASGTGTFAGVVVANHTSATPNHGLTVKSQTNATDDGFILFSNNLAANIKIGWGRLTSNSSYEIFSPTSNIGMLAATTFSVFTGVGFTENFSVAASGAVTIGNGSTALTRILSATATLDFPSIGSNDTETLTITVTGAVAGDSVFLGCPAGLDAGLVFCASVTAADTVTVRMHNSTGGAVDPASATFRATVIRF